MELWTEAKAVNKPIKQEQNFQGCTVTVSGNGFEVLTAALMLNQVDS